MAKLVMVLLLLAVAYVAADGNCKEQCLVANQQCYDACAPHDSPSCYRGCDHRLDACAKACDGETTVDAVEDAGCNDADKAALKAHFTDFHGLMKDCAKGCWGGADCTTKCITPKIGLTATCGGCFGADAGCVKSNCMFKCVNPDSDSCLKCAHDKCEGGLLTCTGLAKEDLPSSTVGTERPLLLASDCKRACLVANQKCYDACAPIDKPSCYNGCDHRLTACDAACDSSELELSAVSSAVAGPAQDYGFALSSVAGVSLLVAVAVVMVGTVVGARYVIQARRATTPALDLLMA